MKFIDLDRQYREYRQEIDSAINRVLESGQFILGSTVSNLEKTLADFVGVPFAIATSSGTDGLLLALMAEGTGPGDEIITTPFTFIATAEVIMLLRARPVFVDIEPDTFNLSVEKIQEALEERRKAGGQVRGIMPVSLYGQCADMDEIDDLAAQEGLFVIEDACQSFGAMYRGRRSCALSRYGVTSFFPSKPLGCYGDGGMVFTDSSERAEKLRAMRVHGQSRRYRHDILGINGRLDAIQAAILLAKFPHFEHEIELRQQAANRYMALLSERAPAVTLPVVREDRTSVFAQFTVRVPRRDAVVEFLKGRGIPTAVHYPLPLHMQKVFSHLEIPEGAFPEAERASREVLSLPMHPFITADEQERIVEALADALKSCGV